MKTHELKLDIKYFDDVKSGKKNFEVRKNDRDFQVGDILEMKAWGSSLGQHAFKKKDEKWHSYGRLADTIKAKILNVVLADEYNTFQESVNGIPQSIKWANSYQETYIKTINGVLKEYFSTDRLPDDYVILGIEVVEE